MNETAYAKINLALHVRRRPELSEYVKGPAPIRPIVGAC
jgi:hypothetical protein